MMNILVIRNILFLGKFLSISIVLFLSVSHSSCWLSFFYSCCQAIEYEANFMEDLFGNLQTLKYI